jgi:Translation-initiation factor 2
MRRWEEVDSFVSFVCVWFLLISLLLLLLLLLSLWTVQELPVELEIISSSLGSIGESELKMAKEFNATVYGFDVPREADAKVAENVHEFKVIYSLVDHVLEELRKLLPPATKQVCFAVPTDSVLLSVCVCVCVCVCGFWCAIFSMCPDVSLWCVCVCVCVCVLLPSLTLLVCALTGL